VPNEQPSWLARLADFERNLGSDGEDFWIGLAHGSMRVELFAPVGRDSQEPHDQDEIYIVLRGSATFEKDGVSVEVGAGDVIFVEAGVQHRFATFSEDFGTWVIFWGPKGGE